MKIIITNIADIRVRLPVIERSSSRRSVSKNAGSLVVAWSTKFGASPARHYQKLSSHRLLFIHLKIDYNNICSVYLTRDIAYKYDIQIICKAHFLWQ